MSELSKQLLKEINERESLFAEKLANLGNQELTTLYSDIHTLKRSLEILEIRVVSEPTKEIIESQITLVKSENNNPQKFNGMTDAVRRAVKRLTKQQFTVNDVYDELVTLFPSDINPDKKPSISATLGNLASSREIERVEGGGPGKPTIFKTT